MRTIKFRGKAILNTFSINEEEAKIKIGDWVYGAVIPFDDGIDLIYERDPNNPEICGCLGIEVDHNTIGQFTGLYDKNGKEIYEGDIIRSWYDDIDYVQKGIVEWKNGCFVYSDDIANWPASTLFVGTIHCEVIGNIYDNKELLTQN